MDCVGGFLVSASPFTILPPAVDMLLCVTRVRPYRNAQDGTARQLQSVLELRTNYPVLDLLEPQRQFYIRRISMLDIVNARLFCSAPSLASLRRRSLQ